MNFFLLEFECVKCHYILKVKVFLHQHTTNLTYIHENNVTQYPHQDLLQ